MSDERKSMLEMLKEESDPKGYTLDQKAVEDWLADKRKTCPVCGEVSENWVFSKRFILLDSLNPGDNNMTTCSCRNCGYTFLIRDDFAGLGEFGETPK